MSNFKKLKQHFEQKIVPIEAGFVNQSWSDKRVYADWLAQTYFYVCHSTRLLALAAGRFKVDRDGLHVRFMAHMKEERQHEALALSDLSALGYKISDFEESPVVSAFYRSQYYWIEHEDPIAFFGYILMLEGLAVRSGDKGYEKAKVVHGDKACKFLRVHANEDPDHLDKAFESLQGVSDDHLSLVKRNLDDSLNLYGLLLQDIELAKRGAKSAKAA